MQVKYNVTGARRKELVMAIGTALEVKPKYMGMPTAAYQIDYFTVTKDGTLEFDDRADSEEVERVLEAIAAAGFDCEPQDGEKETIEEVSETAAENATEGENTGLTVEIPLDKVSMGNLTNLLDSKGTLIRKALGIEDIRIEVKEDRVSFPWFTELPDADSVKAYTHFIAALCKLSKEQSRVNATEKDVANEKYAFRCFLLRLGFIGAEYKTERKILLKNLSGNSSWKNGAPTKEESECSE